MEYIDEHITANFIWGDVHSMVIISMNTQKCHLSSDLIAGWGYLMSKISAACQLHVPLEPEGALSLVFYDETSKRPHTWEQGVSCVDTLSYHLINSAAHIRLSISDTELWHCCRICRYTNIGVS